MSAEGEQPVAIEGAEGGSRSSGNPLGVKGVGEGGAISPPAAIANAVEDALQPFDIQITRAPLTPSLIRSLLSAT